MALREIMISVVLMGAIVLGMGSFYMNLATQTQDPSLHSFDVGGNLESFDMINNTIATTSQMQNQYLLSVQKIPALGFLASIAIEGANIASFALSIPNFFFAVANDLVKFFSLPPYTIQIMQALIGISVIFILVSIFLRYRI